MRLQILRSPVRFRLRPETALFFLFCARARVCAAVGQNNTQDMSLWPNWTRRLTTNQKIGGSSPSRDMFFSLDHPRRLHKGHNGHRCQHTFYWGISSIGRVRALQARGTGIETLMLHFFFSEKYKKTKHLNTNSHIVPHFGLASIAWMAERSKALDSSSSIFGCVGSNPTPSIFLYE